MEVGGQGKSLRRPGAPGSKQMACEICGLALLKLFSTSIQFHFLVSKSLSDLYMINVPLIAGCPGLVPGWRAFPAIKRVPLLTPPPVLFRLSRNTAEAKKDRWRGVRWQSRIVAVYRAPPRHKTGAASETLNRYSDVVRQVPGGKF